MNSCLISCTLILNTKNRVYSEYRLNLVFDGKIAHMCGWNKVYRHLFLSFIPKETTKFLRYYKKKSKNGGI